MGPRAVVAIKAKVRVVVVHIAHIRIKHISSIIGIRGFSYKLIL